MPVAPFKNWQPQIGSDCFLAPTAWVTGQACLGANVSVFFGATIRGDINQVIVGANSNIQENALLHTSHGLGDCIVGESVTIGHSAIIHGCKIDSNCIIGMGAIILDQAEIGANCIIGAGSLVTMGTKIPAGSMAFGSPAKVIRQLRAEEIESIRASAASYIEVGREYARYFAEQNS